MNSVFIGSCFVMMKHFVMLHGQPLMPLKHLEDVVDARMFVVPASPR